MFTIFLKHLSFGDTDFSSGFIQHIFRLCLEDNESLMSLKQYEGE